MEATHPAPCFYVTCAATCQNIATWFCYHARIGNHVGTLV